MTLLDQQLPASFRGVEFFVRSEVQDSSGRKIVLHEYVNSPERFIEDLGQLSPTFRIDAFVHGQNFLQNAARLEAALNEGGFGQVSLPILGVFSVQALPYTKDASQTSVGEIRYSLEFATGRPEAGPVASRQTERNVFAAGDTARQTIAQNTPFEVPRTAENIQVMSGDIDSLSGEIESSIESLLDSSNLERVRNITEEIQRSATQLTQNIEGVTDLFIATPTAEGLWQWASIGLTRTGFTQQVQAVNTLLELTTIGRGALLSIDSAVRSISGTDFPLWPATTSQRIQRNSNRTSIVNMNRLNALVAAYEVAANADYQTQDEINEVRESLEAAHEELFFDATDDPNIVQSVPSVRTAIEAVRVASLAVIEQKRQQTTSTTTIELLSPQSSFTETYRLYAEDFLQASQLEERAMEIRALNPNDPASSLTNEITVFRT